MILKDIFVVFLERFHSKLIEDAEKSFGSDISVVLSLQSKKCIYFSISKIALLVSMKEWSRFIINSFAESLCIWDIFQVSTEFIHSPLSALHSILTKLKFPQGWSQLSESFRFALFKSCLPSNPFQNFTVVDEISQSCGLLYVRNHKHFLESYSTLLFPVVGCLL